MGKGSPPKPSLARRARQAGVYACLQCLAVFAAAGGLSRHYQATGHDGHVRQHLPAKFKKRHRHSFREKRDILVALEKVRSDPHHPNYHQPQKYVARCVGISESMLSKWIRKDARIYELARTRGKGKKKSEGRFNPQWPEAELRLYCHFLFRRRIQGRRVTYRWLRNKFKDIRRRAGHDVHDWHPSRGWCSNFCRRWEISYQCRTNKHKRSIEERLPAIQAFHQHWIYGVQRSFPQRDPKYGRFPRNRVYAMDQVPFAFQSPNQRTLNEKGAPKGCWTVGSSVDTKRFLTLQLTLCGDPADQDCNLEIIFSSKSGGEQMPQEEKDYYAAQFPDINIRWQAKAWADSPVMMDWLMDFREQTLAKGEVALLMDNHGSQRIDEFRTTAELMNVNVVYTPANCTDCVSPVDRNVGKWIKDRAYQLQEDELDTDDWDGDEALSTGDKRKLSVKWIAQAWRELRDDVNRQHLLDSCFVDTGVCIACDGSENSKIKLYPNAQLGEYDY